MAAAGMRTRFAVLDCEDAPKWVGHESVWVAAYGRPGEHWEHFRAWAHELPDLAELDTYQGMVITGSHHDAWDETSPWLAALCDFLQEAVKQGGVKILGGCFGCQVLARALGGRVGRNPHGSFVVGVERLELTRALAQRRDFARARSLCPLVETKADAAKFRGPGLHVLTSHFDAVLQLPPGAELLAASPRTQVELWALGKHVLGQQGHPEMCPAHVRELIVPGLLAKGLITQQQADTAAAEVGRPLDGKLLLAMGRAFLRGDSPAAEADTVDDIAAAVAAAAAVPLGEASPTGAAGASGDQGAGGQGAAGAGEDGGAMAPEGASHAAARLFASGAAALRGELSLLNGEYALLRHMNDAAATNYAHLADVASGLTVFADALAAKDASLAPYLHMIDAIDSQVGELEAVVSTLDNYTRRLESRVRALHDRH